MRVREISYTSSQTKKIQNKTKQNKTPRLSFYTPELLKNSSNKILPLTTAYPFVQSWRNKFRTQITTPRLARHGQRQTLEVQRTGSKNLVNCSLASHKRDIPSLSRATATAAAAAANPYQIMIRASQNPQAQSMTQRTTAGAALETELDCLAATKRSCSRKKQQEFPFPWKKPERTWKFFSGHQIWSSIDTSSLLLLRLLLFSFFHIIIWVSFFLLSFLNG